MTLDLLALQHLAQTGVDVRISAADLLQVLDAMVQSRMQRPRGGEPLTVPEYAAWRRVTTKTVYNWIARGAVHAKKEGGVWYVEQ